MQLGIDTKWYRGEGHAIGFDLIEIHEDAIYLCDIKFLKFRFYIFIEL